MTASRPRAYDVVVEREGEGFYVASVPALPGCKTHARSLDDLMEGIIASPMPLAAPTATRCSACAEGQSAHAATTTDSCPCSLRVGVTRTSTS